jgi:RNA polymerase sigma-70 factor, ECF subfamily
MARSIGISEGKAGVRSQQDTDDGLTVDVAAAQAGDEEAFRRVYRAVQPLLLRYLRVLVRDAADDVASEAWLHIVRDLRTFRGDFDGFRGWAATIARHRALDHLRWVGRRPVELVAPEETADRPVDEDPEALALDALATERAIRLIRTLPRDQAEAVMLRAVMGLDTISAALVLGKRAGAVRTATYRGLRRLAEQLGQADETVRETVLTTVGVTPARPTALRNMR